jgi:hypothetical protein
MDKKSRRSPSRQQENETKLKMGRSIQPLAKLKMGWSIECPAKLKMDPMPSKTQNERTSKNTENPLQKPKQEQYKST